MTEKISASCGRAWRKLLVRKLRDQMSTNGEATCSSLLCHLPQPQLSWWDNWSGGKESWRCRMGRSVTTFQSSGCSSRYKANLITQVCNMSRFMQVFGLYLYFCTGRSPICTRTLHASQSLGWKSHFSHPRSTEFRPRFTHDDQAKGLLGQGLLEAQIWSALIRHTQSYTRGICSQCIDRNDLEALSGSIRII